MSAADPITLRAHELHEVVGWIDARVRDAGGRRLGRVSAVFADAQGTPWWIVVRHRGRDVVAPVDSVYGTRHHELLLDRPVEDLATSAGDIDERTHRALLARYGLDDPGSPVKARRRGDCVAAARDLPPRRPA